MQDLLNQVAAIAELRKEATPGPWVQWEEHPSVYAGPAERNTPASLSGVRVQVAECRIDTEYDMMSDFDEEQGPYNGDANAAFIAAVGGLDFDALAELLHRAATPPAPVATGGAGEALPLADAGLLAALRKMADLRKCLSGLGTVKAKIGHNGAKKADFVSCDLYDGLRITWGEEYGESTATSRALADLIVSALNLDYAALAATPAAKEAAPLGGSQDADAKIPGRGYSYHMGIDVAGMLINGKKSCKGLVSDDNDNELSPRDTRAWLVDQLEKGRKVLPMGECDNWDYLTGCKGHLEPEDAAQ